jgi:hypothetical protein
MSNATHLHHYGRSLDVHRVTPGSEYSLERGACVTLCRICHNPEPKSPKGANAGKGWFVRLTNLTEDQRRSVRILAALQEVPVSTWIKQVVLEAIENGKEAIENR